MKLSRGHKKRIEQIIVRMECEKHFECYKSGFVELCKARLVVDKKLPGGCGVECVKPKQKHCKFRTSFGSKVFCSCPLRVYAAKNLNK
ncbi:MAG: hypothetical protein ACYS0C_03595 [Planctomycetota bacterium]